MSSTNTNIAWTDRSWNPIRGCSRISEGCEHCYAEAMAHRFGGPGKPYEGLVHNRRWTGDVNVVHKDLTLPLTWRTPSMVFVASMSDPFHANVSDELLCKLIDIMGKAGQHEYQVLTKRPERLASFGRRWPVNAWVGVSVESAKHLDRVDHLRNAPVDGLRWISAEPLLGPLPNIDLTGISWVVVGGESGPGARLMEPAWVRDIIGQCRAAKIPVFVKQMGTAWSQLNLSRRGKADKPEEWPEDLRVRKYPLPPRSYA